MRAPRTRLAINAGNLLELLGAASAVYGLARVAGLGYGLMLLGVLLVVGAELVYDAKVWRVPLPHRPRVGQRVRVRYVHGRQRLAVWWAIRTGRVVRWRASRG